MASTAIAVCDDVAAQLRGARQESDRLFAALTDAAFYARPIDARHRVIFYLGHLDGFDSIQICREGLNIPSKDGVFDDLFQAGIDPGPGQLPTDTPKDWPTLSEVRAYAQRCRYHVDQNLLDAPVDTVHMALEHRLMHLETLAYMFHNLPYDLKRGVGTQRHVTFGSGPANEWCLIPAGETILGKKRADGVFGWDNESEEHTAFVPGFRMQKYNVTNGDYLTFVEHQGASLPNFWREANGKLWLRGMFEDIPLPLDWPVWVSQREAQAYAEFVGSELPTEEQFGRAAYSDGRAPFPWQGADADATRGNFDFRRWDPEPVSATPSGDSPFGVSQLIGNGWEWTRSVFRPFEGFEPRASYPGYSANFFDGEHYVLKGASPRTSAVLVRRSFRNWFRADYPYVYAAFRCVRNG